MPGSQEEAEYCRKLLDSLAVRPRQVASLKVRSAIRRNAAKFITQLLLARLDQVESSSSIERGTFRWANGLINIRSTSGNFFWTNLTESVLEKLKALSGPAPFAFLFGCWSPEGSEVHVWAVPGSIISENISTLPSTRDGIHRSLRIHMSRQRIEGSSKSPDLQLFYRRILWESSEKTQLQEALKIDRGNRWRSIDIQLSAFIALMRLFHAQRTVFRHIDRNLQYYISAVDDTGCTIQQIQGSTISFKWNRCKKIIAAIKRADCSMPLSEIVEHHAMISAILQSDSIVPASDRQNFRLLISPEDAESYVQQRIRSCCESDQIHAGILMAFLRAMSETALFQNQVSSLQFWESIDSLFQRCELQVLPEQLVAAVCRLFQCGILLPSQMQPAEDVCTAAMNRNRFVSAISHVSLHAVVWSVVQMPTAFGRLESVLQQMAPAFFSKSCAPNPPRTLGESVKLLLAQIAARGFVYQPWQIACYITALRTKPFVILAGVSGTGKTKLPMLVAKLTGQPAPRRIAVRPDWTDSSEVMGYLDLQGNFRPGVVLQHIRHASSDGHHFHVCIVDEMNLARVEHYFAEYLSAVEECIPESGGGFASTPLLSQGQSIDFGEWASQVLPRNFAVVGTVNMDDSTQAFSRKVLDRAFTIELGEIDFTGRSDSDTTTSNPITWPADWWIANYRRICDVPIERAEFDPILDRVIRTLKLLNTVLTHAQMQLGYRTRDEIALFVLNAGDILESFVTRTAQQVDPLDIALMTKVLPRLVGSSNVMRQILAGLINLAQTGDTAELDTDPSSVVVEWEAAGQPSHVPQTAFPFTLARLCLMYQRLEHEGYTSFWL